MNSKLGNAVARIGVLAALGTLSGCSVEVESGEGGVTHVEEATEGLSATSEQCHASHPNGPPVDQTFVEMFPSSPPFTTPPSYGSSQCGEAYVVNLEDARGSWQNSGHIYRDRVYPATMPTSQSECQKYRLGVYAWNIDTATPALEFSQWKWGTWSNGACSLTISPQETPGSRYRMAMSLRRHSVAGDPNSNRELKAMKLRNYWN